MKNFNYPKIVLEATESIERAGRKIKERLINQEEFNLPKTIEDAAETLDEFTNKLKR